MDFVQFENNGRTLTCRSGLSPATAGTVWWWLQVSGDPNRYAAFGASASDTEKNVRDRMIAWHEKLLFDRARPPEIRQRWGRPPAKPAAPAAPSEGSAEG